MKDIDEIRRANMRLLEQEFGGWRLSLIELGCLHRSSATSAMESRTPKRGCGEACGRLPLVGLKRLLVNQPAGWIPTTVRGDRMRSENDPRLLSFEPTNKHLLPIEQ